MKTILTHTGKIYVDTEHRLEFLTVGDYGKQEMGSNYFNSERLSCAL